MTNMQMTHETLVGWVIKYITLQEFLGIKFMVINKNKYTQVIKKKYYSRLSNMMIDPMTSSRVYWSTLKMSLNNKKIPFIPPLSHQDNYVTNFKEKAKIFNSSFAEQCSFVNISSKLPSTLLKRAEKIF